MLEFFPSRQIFFSLGSLDVHWYGLMYVCGFLVGYPILKRLLRYRDLALTEKQLESLVLHVFFGVIIGGRLGYVLFYGGSEYFLHPLDIFKVWEGGMASHGGFIGVIVALLVFTRGNLAYLLKLGDVLVVPIAIGLAFGRLGNLINGELYGTVTALPWGMNFPGVEGLRHPTQIYAIMKNLTIALACFLSLRTSWPTYRPGMTVGLFLCLYAVLRFIVEIFREQALQSVPFIGFELSRGQLLTLPIVVLGLVILGFTRKRVSSVPLVQQHVRPRG